jgi:DNA-binding LytR/AlgR family response regulator
VKIAICDDDVNICRRLSDEITNWANERKIAVNIMTYPSAEAFQMAWADISFDLAFLDIKMKRMTGIELAEFIRSRDKTMMIVFVTSYTNYTLSGYDLDALHYLIKPLSPFKLVPVLDKAATIWRSRVKSVLIVSDGEGRMKLPFDDIFYIEMLSHTASIHTESKLFELRRTAEELSNMLPEYFVRCHRSFVVNLFKVDCCYKDSLLLNSGEKLPISRNNTKLVNDVFIKLNT